MAIPFRCPVCNGTGLVPRNFYLAIGVTGSLGNAVMAEKCRSCSGTGIVWDYTNTWFNSDVPLFIGPPTVTPSTGDPLPPVNPTTCLLDGTDL